MSSNRTKRRRNAEKLRQYFQDIDDSGSDAEIENDVTTLLNVSETALEVHNIEPADEIRF